MKVLHIFTESILSEVLKKSICAKKGTYTSVCKAQMGSIEMLKNKYDLIILENEGITSDCEAFVHSLTKDCQELIAIIVITDICDFDQKSNLYDLGVMAILSRKPFNETKFDMYLEAVLRDVKTIEVLKRLKIAVVDDSRFSLEIIKSFFIRIGVYNVDYFQSAEKIGDVSKNYDFFLVDLVMPDVNGEELIYSVRQSNPDAIIILITSYSEGRAIQYCLSIGADDFILKPFDFKVFILRINASISHYQLSQENKINSKKLYDLATKDTLTQVFNRTYFIESIHLKSNEAKRNHLPFSMILLDLDNFKQINDEYGHQKGDLVLIYTAKALKKNLRDSDIVCRWGGEEFCVLLINTTREEAIKVAEKLRSEIAQLSIEGIRPITESFGVTFWELEDADVSAFKRLDNSLYLAKLTGKNKVVSNEELLILSGTEPVAVEWGPFFRSGNDQIDKEHHKMIQISNEIIKSCFDENSYERTVKLFDILINDTVGHFDNEENLLEKVGYSNLEEHKEIHKQLINRTLFLQKGLASGKLSPLQVAKYVIQDVVIGHIIKSDFDYYDYFR